MKLVSKLKFEEYLMLETAIDQRLPLAPVLDLLGLDYSNAEDKYADSLSHDDSDWFFEQLTAEERRREGLEFVALTWLRCGYMPTQTPAREAKIFLKSWKSRNQKTTNDSPHSGYVYILKAGEHYKIGRTKEPPRRVPQLFIHLPFEARLWALFFVEDMYKTEAAMHKFYGKYHTNGEWFSLPFEEAIYLRLNQGRTWGVFIKSVKKLAAEEWGQIEFVASFVVPENGSVRETTWNR